MNIFRTIFNFLYEIFLGCSHEKLTRTFTLEQQTYKVCLNCGSKVYYSPDTMRPLHGREMRRMRALHASEVKLISPTGASMMMPGNNGKPNAA
jgi:hypothetical protein